MTLSTPGWVGSSMWILRDAGIWFMLHMIAVYLCHKTPNRVYTAGAWFFGPRRWEQAGRFYQRWFFVRHWKDRLPDAGQMNEHGFPKARLQKAGAGYLERFVVETMRAEAIHWLGLSFSLVFLWIHPLPRGFAVFAAAALLDLPFIIIQRYNRPRLQKLLNNRRRRCMP